MSVNFKYLLGPMRLPFLMLTPACVLLGAAAASYTGAPLRIWQLLILLAGAVSAHISVNALNEYFDFRSGLDQITKRTPFSGGSGTLPARPQAARSALITGLASLAITAVVGVFFVILRGWGLLLPGLIGLALIYFYTTYLLRNPFTSLIAPGVGFGILMVMGSAFAMGGGYTWTSFTASLIPTFLVSNLLLLNQFPDVEADRQVGRRHYPILIGRKASSYIYASFNLAAYIAILAGITLEVLPGWCLLALLTLLLAVPASITAVRFADDIPHLVPAMGMNVMVNILTPLLTAVGLWIGR